MHTPKKPTGAKKTFVRDPQKEFRGLLNDLIRLEDERDALDRKVKRLRRREKQLEAPLTADEILKLRTGGIIARVKKSCLCRREAQKAESARFSLSLRIRTIEKYIVANFR